MNRLLGSWFDCPMSPGSPYDGPGPVNIAATGALGFVYSYITIFAFLYITPKLCIYHKLCTVYKAVYKNLTWHSSTFYLHVCIAILRVANSSYAHMI